MWWKWMKPVGNVEWSPSGSKHQWENFLFCFGVTKSQISARAGTLFPRVSAKPLVECPFTTTVFKCKWQTWGSEPDLTSSLLELTQLDNNSDTDAAWLKNSLDFKIVKAKGYWALFVSPFFFFSFLFFSPRALSTPPPPPACLPFISEDI